jgi:formiminoglutamase
LKSPWTSVFDLLTRAADAPAPFSVVGVPIGTAAITPGRCDLAPASIRQALRRISAYDVTNDVDLSATAIVDCGDLPVNTLTPEDADAPIRSALDAIVARTSGTVICLGGNNCVTRPAVRGLAARNSGLGLMTLDAHHDVRETTSGLNNGNPVRALIEDGFDPRRVVQIGIQPFANSQAHTAWARAQGITFFGVAEVRRHGIEAIVRQALELLRSCSGLYLDLDLDVMDRASVPSTAGSRPGGLAVADVLNAVRVLGASGRIAGMDLVEHDPERDVQDTTALTAGLCLATFLSAATQERLSR